MRSKKLATSVFLNEASRSDDKNLAPGSRRTRGVIAASADKRTHPDFEEEMVGGGALTLGRYEEKRFTTNHNYFCKCVGEVSGDTAFTDKEICRPINSGQKKSRSRHLSRNTNHD